MEYSYKFRIYPKKKQIQQIECTFGCCRYVYNHYLSKRQEAYEQNRQTLNYYECAKDMTQLKNSLEWLKQTDSTALQSSLRDLDTAYQNFFRRVKQRELPGYPRFKSKRDHRQSYQSKCVGTNIKVMDKAVQLPKLGKVNCRISKQVQGRILSATISRNPSGKYYVALCCTDMDAVPFPQTGAAVGIQMGIKALAISSDGKEYPNYRYLVKSQKSSRSSNAGCPEKQRAVQTGKSSGLK